MNPDANRIVDLMFDGKPIDPAAKFVVATNNYRAGGGGSFPGADGSTVILVAPDTNRDVDRALHRRAGHHLAERRQQLVASRPPAAPPSLYDTGPASAAYLEDVRARGLAIEPAGDAPDGFLRYRITL